MLRFRRVGAMLFVLALLFSALCGCTPLKDDRPIVAVSILPEAAFVRAVFGDGVRVAVRVPPGYSPESYTPTIAEMADFSDAVLYFSIGVPMEKIIRVHFDKLDEALLQQAMQAFYFLHRMQ